jgi:hypothetical protein
MLNLFGKINLKALGAYSINLLNGVFTFIIDDALLNIKDKMLIILSQVYGQRMYQQSECYSQKQQIHNILEKKTFKIIGLLFCRAVSKL